MPFIKSSRYKYTNINSHSNKFVYFTKSIVLAGLPPSLEYNIVREKGHFQDMMQRALSRVNTLGTL